jgi:protein SCO1/2
VHPRLRLTFMTVVTLVLAVAGTVLLTTDPSPAPSRIPVTTLAGGIRPDGPPVSIALRDEEGRMVRAGDLRGRPVIVTFLYTLCQNDCPTIAAQIRIALDRLGAPVPVLAVTVDPRNDTAAARRRFLARHYLTGRMHFLNGSPGELQRVWRVFGIQPQSAGAEHSAYVVVLDRAGRQRAGFPVDQLTPEGLAHDVRVLGARRSG